MTSLGDADLQAIHSVLNQRSTFKAGQEITRAGDPTDRLHVMVTGWACRCKLMRSGARQIVAVLIPGDPCDFDGILVSRQDSSVVALTAIEVAIVSRDALLGIARERPGVANMLLWLTTLDNALLGECVSSLGRRSTRQRVAHLFCELVVRLTGIGKEAGFRCPLPLTQEMLADTLGVTPVHINRVLQALRSDGLIELHAQELTVLNWPALAEVAGFDPAYLHLSGMRAVAFG